MIHRILVQMYLKEIGLCHLSPGVNRPGSPRRRKRAMRRQSNGSPADRLPGRLSDCQETCRIWSQQSSPLDLVQPAKIASVSGAVESDFRKLDSNSLPVRREVDTPVVITRTCRSVAHDPLSPFTWLRRSNKYSPGDAPSRQELGREPLPEEIAVEMGVRWRKFAIFKNFPKSNRLA